MTKISMVPVDGHNERTLCFRLLCLGGIDAAFFIAMYYRKHIIYLTSIYSQVTLGSVYVAVVNAKED